MCGRKETLCHAALPSESCEAIATRKRGNRLRRIMPYSLTVQQERNLYCTLDSCADVVLPLLFLHRRSCSVYRVPLYPVTETGSRRDKRPKHFAPRAQVSDAECRLA